MGLSNLAISTRKSVILHQPFDTTLYLCWVAPVDLEEILDIVLASVEKLRFYTPMVAP